MVRFLRESQLCLTPSGPLEKSKTKPNRLIMSRRKSHLDV